MIPPHACNCGTCLKFHRKIKGVERFNSNIGWCWDGTVEGEQELIFIDKCHVSEECGLCCHSSVGKSSQDVLEQCETCYLKGTRACQYHGYPDNVIEKSCRYKVGIDAQFALNNLAGTFIIKNLRTKERER